MRFDCKFNWGRMERVSVSVFSCITCSQSTGIRFNYCSLKKKLKASELSPCHSVLMQFKGQKISSKSTGLNDEHFKNSCILHQILLQGREIMFGEITSVSW